jgi:hypothetical protein
VKSEVMEMSADGMIRNFGTDALRDADALAQKYRQAGDMQAAAVWSAIAAAIRQRHRVKSANEGRPDQIPQP